MTWWFLVMTILTSAGDNLVRIVDDLLSETAPDEATAPPLALSKTQTAPMPIIESKMQTPIQAPRTSKKK